jgi:hypothetical protein
MRYLNPLRLLTAFTVAFVLTLAAGMPADTASAQRERVLMAHHGDLLMANLHTVKNTSARLVHINIGTEVISIAPLKEITIQPEQLEAVGQALDGPLKAFVASGDLVIDGKPLAPPVDIEPQRAAIQRADARSAADPRLSAPPVEPLRQGSDSDSDTDPAPAQSSASAQSAASSQEPAAQPSGSSSSKRR